ncbi:MAG: cytochrome c [Pseudomonadota bacterium]
MQHKALSICIALACACAATANSAENITMRDYRMPIPVTSKERNQTLFEMREMLHGLFSLHLALSKNDFKGVATVARPMGHLLEKLPAGLRERLPEEYNQLAIAMRESFDILAREAEEKKDIAAVQEQLAETMTYCSGCHDTYRFEVFARIPPKQ